MELRDGLRAVVDEMTAEAEEKLAALKPAERQFALKRSTVRADGLKGFGSCCLAGVYEG